MERWPTSFWKNTFLRPWGDPQPPRPFWVNSKHVLEIIFLAWVYRHQLNFNNGGQVPCRPTLYPPTLLADHIWGQLGNLSSRQIESNPSHFSFNPSIHSLRRVGRTAGVSVYLHTSMTSIEWLTVSHFCSAYICRTVTITVCVCLIIKDNLLVILHFLH